MVDSLIVGGEVTRQRQYGKLSFSAIKREREIRGIIRAGGLPQLINAPLMD